jgi:hypothetical protein
MQGGTLIDLTASPTAVYTLAQTGDLPFVTDLQSFRRTPQFSGQLFQGGSGRNVISTGTLSGTNAPIGYFRQIAEDVWGDGYGTEITFDPSDGSASMDNGADQIATMGAGAATIAPYGTFSSTATGDTIYNGGTPFSLTADYEGRTVFPELSLEADGTSIVDGDYIATGWGEWVSDTDSDWTISVDATGLTELSDSVDIVASGSSDIDGVAANILTSTAYGATNYNSGVVFGIVLSPIPVPAPIAGYLYVTVTLAAGVVTGMTGPSYAAAMPANSSTAKHVPICHSNGSSVYQIQQGPILWR